MLQIVKPITFLSLLSETKIKQNLCAKQNNKVMTAILLNFPCRAPKTGLTQWDDAKHYTKQICLNNSSMKIAVQSHFPLNFTCI